MENSGVNMIAWIIALLYPYQAYEIHSKLPKNAVNHRNSVAVMKIPKTVLLSTILKKLQTIKDLVRIDWLRF